MPFMKKVNIPRDGLVAEYLANNNFLDTSGNGYNGINNNVTFGADRNSNPNSAFVLNGTTAFVDIDAALAGLATTTSGTWSAWVKPVDATPTSIEVLITFGDANASEHMRFDMATNGTLEMFARNVSGIKFRLDTDNAVFVNNTWVHVLMVQDGISPILYVGGIAVNQRFSTSTDTTWFFNDSPNLDTGRLGSLDQGGGGNTNHFDGSMSDIRIYNRVLTQEEITILANE